MIREHVMEAGHVRIEVRRDGRLVEVREQPNLITTAGRTLFAQLRAAAGTAPSHIALGTGTTPAAIGDTALGAEVARVAMATRTAAGAVTTYTANFPPGTGTGTLREAGCFNAESGGTLSNRVVFTEPLVKAAGDDVTITWTITGN